MKTALSIAGSDSSGGAGIQADLKTFSVLGVYGMTAITAITAQNTLGVKQVLEIDPELVRKQIDVTASDIEVDACKTGMLAGVALVEVVEDCIGRNKLQPYVCDPVMVAKSGDVLVKKEAAAAMKKRLFPLAAVVTPNKRETALLTDADPNIEFTIAIAKDAARRIVGGGAKAVVIKGIASADQSVDLFFDGREFLEFATKTMPGGKTHGSGCVFAAAITAGLATGKTLVDAIDQAKQVATMAIQHSDGQGRGTSPVNVLAFAPKKK